MSAFTDFMTALRSGNMEQARQFYSTMQPNSQSDTVEDTPPPKMEEDATEGARPTGTDSTSASAPSGDSPFGAGATPSPIAPALELDKMEETATLPDKAIMNELKGVRDMIKEAKAAGKLQDKDTKKAIAKKHKELLEKLIDNAFEEE